MNDKGSKLKLPRTSPEILGIADRIQRIAEMLRCVASEMDECGVETIVFAQKDMIKQSLMPLEIWAINVEAAFARAKVHAVAGSLPDPSPRKRKPK